MTNFFTRENPTEADRLDLAVMERSLGYKPNLAAIDMIFASMKK